MVKGYSYSQCGEDRLIVFLLQHMTLTRRITYLDIGSGPPIDDNNTYLLNQMGGWGVLVEANPKYKDEYSVSRPTDVLLNMACVPNSYDTKEIDFYMADDPGWHSVSREHAELAIKLGKSQERPPVKIPAMTIDAILAEYFEFDAPDVLSIDIEGVDHLVLAEMNSQRWRPKIIVAENAGGQRIHDTIMTERGYRLFGYTFVNSIYVDSYTSRQMKF